MKLRTLSLTAALGAATLLAHAQDAAMTLPQTVTAGDAFSIPTSGSGAATLTIAGPEQVLRRDVQLGQPARFAAGVLYGAGRYVAVLVSGSSASSGVLSVAPAAAPKTIGFLARPSRLPVDLHDGIIGTAYIFDAYHNLITTPMPVSFDLSNPNSAAQTTTVTTRNGVAWTQMNSAAREGAAKFVAHAGAASTERVIDEVPGDPCNLSMSAKPDGQKIALQTAPLRDCAGNPVPDGTIVTFTESRRGEQSTVDVPLKQGVARVDMPAWNGATISVASGVVAGNEIRWEGGR